MEIETGILFFGGAALCVLIAVLLLKRKRPSEKNEQAEEELQGDQALYALGMNPISDKPILYSLTTCPHCKNTRSFLDAEHVPYISIFLDEYAGQQRTDLMEKVRTYNPRGSFPTIIMPNGKVIVGYRKQLLQEALAHVAGRTA